MLVATVIGARPQFIKAAVVSRALANSGKFKELLVHTGQHYDSNMSQVFFDELDIPSPTYMLNVGSGPHGAQTGRILESVERVLIEAKPELVLVYGDTNTTLAGALAAAKLHIPVAHVESGLRSFNRRMPEEINRVLTDHMSTWLFAPTEGAVTHLLEEGISAHAIHNVGDVMYDAAIYYAEKAERTCDVLVRFRLKPRQYVLATVHRAENTESPTRLGSIVEGLSHVAGDLPVIIPLHPRTRAALAAIDPLRCALKRLMVVDPVSYLDMVMLEKHARLIATDSGGVQKEAFFHGVQCVTFRGETEWVELVDMGWNRLVLPESPEAVSTAVYSALACTTGVGGQPYGCGQAGDKIAQLLSGDWAG